MFKKPEHLPLSHFFIYRMSHLLLPVAAALLQTQLCQELWRIATASQALLIENEPRFTVVIVSVASAFQQHFCSITNGGWRARESSGMLSHAGQQQGIRHLSSQHCRAAPDTSTAAHLRQPGRQASWKEKLPEGWAPSHGWLPMGCGEQNLAPGSGAVLTLAGMRV